MLRRLLRVLCRLLLEQSPKSHRLKSVNHKQSAKDDYGTLGWIHGNGNGLKGRT